MGLTKKRKRNFARRDKRGIGSKAVVPQVISLEQPLTIVFHSVDHTFELIGACGTTYRDCAARISRAYAHIMRISLHDAGGVLHAAKRSAKEANRRST